MGQHGMLAWYELASRDLNGARMFYEKVLGCTARDAGMFTHVMVSYAVALTSRSGTGCRTQEQPRPASKPTIIHRAKRL